MADTRIGNTSCVGLLIVILTSTAVHALTLNTYFLTDFCSKSFSFQRHNVDAFVLRVTINDSYSPNMNCTMKVSTAIGYRILYVFQYIDVPNCRDYASVYQFKKGQYHSLDSQICGLPTRRVLATDDNRASISFYSDGQGESRGFMVIVTTFKTGGDCERKKGEMMCGTRRCIHSSLKCSNHDNCGDNSNNKECEDIGITAVKVIGGMVFMGGVALAFHFCRRGWGRGGCDCCCDILCGLVRCKCCKRSRPSTSSHNSESESIGDTASQSVPPSPVLPAHSRYETTPTPESPPLIWTNTSSNGHSTLHDPPPLYEHVVPKVPPPSYSTVI